VDLDI